jgi:hypothetical protein
MTQSKGGHVFLTLFGMVFLSIGVGMGYLSARTLLRAEAMLSWTETPARLVSCDLRVSRGSKGGSSYRVEARYQYEAGGVSRTGDRVSLYSGSDNVGRFQHRVYTELKQCMGRKVPTVCWVNPRDPADAILIRKLRPEMLLFMQLFVLAFGGAGLAIVTAGLSGLLRPSAQAEALAGSARIRMNGTSAPRAAGVLALVWNGYVGWLLWQTHRVMATEAMPWYLWLLAASGVFPAVVAAYLIGRFRKYGVSVFEMSPVPARLGGPVAGTVRIPAKVDTAEGFEVTLQCVHQHTTGSGKQRHTHRDVLWEESLHLDGNVSYGDESMLPVRFAVPGDKPATGNAGGGSYAWQMNVTATAPGIDYKAVFDVPVGAGRLRENVVHAAI